MIHVIVRLEAAAATRPLRHALTSVRTEEAFKYAEDDADGADEDECDEDDDDENKVDIVLRT